jgi:hypothetical protein
LVIGPDDAALDERPEALNRVRVDRANDVLANSVVNRLVREAVLEPLIPRIGICADWQLARRHLTAARELAYATAHKEHIDQLLGSIP